MNEFIIIRTVILLENIYQIQRVDALYLITYKMDDVGLVYLIGSRSGIIENQMKEYLAHKVIFMLRELT